MYQQLSCELSRQGTNHVRYQWSIEVLSPPRASGAIVVVKTQRGQGGSVNETRKVFAVSKYRGQINERSALERALQYAQSNISKKVAEGYRPERPS